ncbi:mdm10-like protein [Metarhizium acridum CQMa 102]|uniref:Mitochondrial distribution and morphology protein 10 n=1 Tax=Metarhizium acridum (strain CQMa 102) TaxID=655827 RepID=E9E6C2_METAQ|nr:mdm10-like protein [Metarhizium acridum CQMa 102]EFY88526.1 mdm10-like protein [Metarhizium acridum CQMa 102]
MREFMDYVHSAFYEATGWRRDNSYAALNATSDALLDFQTPRGLRLTLSSLASANFATSYQLGSVGVVDGSISYLFSSVPLRVHITPQSENVSLPELLRSYRPLTPLSPRDEESLRTLPDAARPESSLLYGRLYLPQSQLEALVVRRLSPALQLQLSAVSAKHLRDGGTVLGLAQYDVGRYAFEGLASSDGGLLGLRGIYNFGGDAHPSSAAEGANHGEKERIYGRFSTGGEIYYGTLNKSGGVSFGTRFATLPAHNGTPLSATLTINPLMGNIAASYAVVAGKHCSLATRMEFNVFSYESARSWSGGWGRTGPCIYNFGGDEHPSSAAEGANHGEKERIYGRFSTGGEIYYGTLNKSGGVSFGTRFATLPAHNGTPLSATLTINPLMGNIAASYAVVAGKHCSLATRMEFNVFSYESAWAVGMELWRKPLRRLGVEGDGPWEKYKERSFQAKLEWRLDEPGPIPPRPPPPPPPSEPGKISTVHKGKTGEEYAGVLKARLDQNWRIGILWEGRVKSLLFSLGSGIDLRKLDKPFRTLGLEIQFSS